MPVSRVQIGPTTRTPGGVVVVRFQKGRRSTQGNLLVVTPDTTHDHPVDSVTGVSDAAGNTWTQDGPCWFAANAKPTVEVTVEVTGRGDVTLCEFAGVSPPTEAGSSASPTLAVEAL
jgi:hypothetical protein